MGKLITYVFLDRDNHLIEEVDLVNDDAAESHGELLSSKTKKVVFVYRHVVTVYPEEAVLLENHDQSPH